MAEDRGQRAAQSFARLLDLYRRPDGPERGGRAGERAAGGVGNPGPEKRGAPAGATGSPPGLWLGKEEASDKGALSATPRDPKPEALLEVVGEASSFESGAV